jgi:hypothetical protein
MKPSAVTSTHPPPASLEAAAKPSVIRAPEDGEAANDDVRTERQRGGSDDPLGPLWLITIGMGAFFGVAALVLALD